MSKEKEEVKEKFEYDLYITFNGGKSNIIIEMGELSTPDIAVLRESMRRNETIWIESITHVEYLINPAEIVFMKIMKRKAQPTELPIIQEGI